MQGYRFKQHMFDAIAEFAYFKKAYWLKIFFHNMTQYDPFQSESEALNCNTENKFSILGNLSDSLKSGEKFVFLLDYPELNAYNTWKQTNNPINEQENGQKEALGFVPLHTGAPRSNWGGLVYSAIHPNTGNRRSLLNGTPNQNDDWFFAIATYGGTWGINYTSIPSNSRPVNIVSLWVRFPFTIIPTCHYQKRLRFKLLFFNLFIMTSK